jgi:hypothetical protein
MLGNWIIDVAAIGAVALTGCMASGVHFAGTRQAAVATADAVEVGAHAPPELRRLGGLSVECSPLAPDDEVEDVRASDLSCSPAFLHSALREAAAAAGGTFLVLPECEDRRRGGRTSWLGCDADVFGPADAKPTVAPAAAGALGSLQEAWHISLHFWPAPGRQRAAPRAAESVAEVDFPGVGQLRLGDLSAACPAGCAPGSMRRGLRAAAAWLGATTLVDVRCIQQGRASSCTASISSPEHDEEAVMPAVTSARD